MSKSLRPKGKLRSNNQVVSVMLYRFGGLSTNARAGLYKVLANCDEWVYCSAAGTHSLPVPTQSTPIQQLSIKCCPITNKSNSFHASRTLKNISMFRQYNRNCKLIRKTNSTAYAIVLYPERTIIPCTECINYNTPAPIPIKPQNEMLAPMCRID